MPQVIRYTLLSARDLLVSFGPFVLLAALLLALAYWWLDPMPPKHITLATGQAQSAYDEFGKRYAKYLAKYGITVQLLPSAGAAENRRLVQSGKADIGFIQGGAHEAEEEQSAELQSLGSLFVEPIWLFYRAESARKLKPDATLTAASQLKGLRVNVGNPGSGVPRLMNTLFEANHIAKDSMTLSRLDTTPAVVAFLNGELDVIAMASAPESLMVQMLLQTPGVKLLDFPQHEAYARRFAFLTAVTLPHGVVDLAGNVPAQDMHLIATTTTLVAGPNVHPALLQLFSHASVKLHRSAGWFNRAHEFPQAANIEYPLAKEADRTMRNGVPMLQRYLPFSLANLVERMWVALGIILAILLPLSRVLPPLYEFRVRSRVFRWYGKLRAIENRMDHQGDNSALLAELTQLEQHTEKISVPLSYADELYALRNYIEMVRRKLTSRP